MIRVEWLRARDCGPGVPVWAVRTYELWVMSTNRFYRMVQLGHLRIGVRLAGSVPEDVL